MIREKGKLYKVTATIETFVNHPEGEQTDYDFEDAAKRGLTDALENQYDFDAEEATKFDLYNDWAGDDLVYGPHSEDLTFEQALEQSTNKEIIVKKSTPEEQASFRKWFEESEAHMSVSMRAMSIEDTGDRTVTFRYKIEGRT